MPFLTLFSPRESREILVLLESKALLVPLVRKAPRARREKRAIPEKRGPWDRRGHKAQQAREEIPEKLARRVFKVSVARRASKDLREIPEIPGLRAPKDLKAIPENRVKRVLPVRRVFPVKWVLSVPLVRREKKGTRLPMPILPRSSWPR